MANASKTGFGAGSHGKGSGTGALTDLPDGLVGDNMVLSNRDKSRHSDERGLDSKTVQVEQLQDSVANREVDTPADDQAANTSGLGGPMSDTSSRESSRKG